MTGFLNFLLMNFRNCIIAGLILAAFMIIGFGVHSPHGFDRMPIPVGRRAIDDRVRVLRTL